MFKVFAGAALVFLLGAGAAFAEPRGDLSPTDEIEPTPRTPPVTEPKPMPRTYMGRPVDAAPPTTATPKGATPPARLATKTPRHATAPRAARTAAPQRRIARTPPTPDMSLSTIFTRPRSAATAPPASVAPQGRPAADAPAQRPAMTYNYAPAPSAPADVAPCAARRGTSLGAMFACTR